MNCEQIRECLTVFLLGDLDEATRLAVEKHLEQCEGCRAQRRELELTLDLVREALSASSQSVAIPQRLTPGRRARVTCASPARRPVRALRWLAVPHPRFALAAAACLVLAFVIAGLMLPAVSKAREKASRGQYCMMGEETAGPVSLSVVPVPRAQEKRGYGGVPSASRQEAAAVAEGDGITDGAAAVRGDRDSTATIVYKSDSDSGRWASGKMGAGGAVGAGGSVHKVKEGADAEGRRSRTEGTPAPATPPPAPPAPVAAAALERQVALDAGGGANAGVKADADGKERASRFGASASRPAPMEGLQSPAAVTLPAPDSASRGATMGIGGGRMWSTDDKSAEVNAKTAPEPSPAAESRLKAGEEAVRSRTYGDVDRSEVLKLTKEGGAAERSKRSAEKTYGPLHGAQNGALVASDDVPAERERNGGKWREAKSGAVDELSLSARGNYSRGPAPAGRAPGAADADETGQKGQQQAELETRTDSRLTGTAEAKDLSKKAVPRDKEVVGAYFGAYYGRYLNPVALRGVQPEKPAASGQPKAAQVGGLVKESTQDNKAPGPYFERKFVEEKKEGDRPGEGNGRTDSSRKVETTTLFGPSLSVLPAREPTQLPAKFKAFGVNQFIEAASQPFSTFSIDVDTASYTVSRNYMLRGQRPPAEAVRTEEFVNFFDYAYAAPTRETFRIYADVAPSRFGRGMHILKIGVKGKRLGREEERGAVLTFLVDTSGSMDKPDRIGLIRKSLKMLIEKLGPQDQVAVVQFDSSARLALDHTPASEKDRIAAVLDSLQCSGSTHLEGGMTLAYQVAARSFKPAAENRVLILSDGVANLGTMAAEDILSKVEAYRKQGIYCSVFGFGIGTFDDTMLETLANKGNGTYAFIDSETEAKRVFVDDLAATLNTIASDVKIQVEFNPKRVAKYRQLGYENRQLKKEDFRNDAVDAGEVGSGQSVTALYEVELKDGRDVLASVRLRYRRTDNGRVEEIERTVTSADVRSDFEKADARFRLAACVAEFSEQLRGSPHAAGTRFADVAEVLQPVALELRLDTRVQELLRLVGGAGSLSLNAQ